MRIYQNLPSLLETELNKKRRLPQRVYFSPSSDLFQPVPEIQEIARKILLILLQRGIETAFLTKGKIEEETWRILERYSSLVFAQIGLISVHDEIRQIFEPNAASVTQRLDQIKRLNSFGINTSVRLDPILPAITDSSEDFSQICAATSECGITRLAASVLFLRPVISSQIRRRLKRVTMAEDLSLKVSRMLSLFLHSQKMDIHAQNSSVEGLPMEFRKDIFDRLRTEAVRFNQTVHICGCKNPDLSNQRCQISGPFENSESQGLLNLE